MTDSIKTSSKEQERTSSVKPDGKNESSHSRGQDDPFDSLQKELLLRARKRAEAASSNPPPPLATDDQRRATPTRIGQPAFQANDSYHPDGEMRREAEHADTVPSFPAPAIPHSEQKETAPPSAPEAEKKSPQVVLRAEVVVVDVEEQAKKERPVPDRRDSRRVLLRDSSVREPIEVDEPGGLADAADLSNGGYIQSEAIAFDEFTADGPLMTSPYEPKRQTASPASNISEVISSTSATRNAADRPREELEPKIEASEPGRSKKSINLGLATAALISVALVAIFFIQRWESPKAAEQPSPEPSAQTTSQPSTSIEAPMTEVTSSPEGAELVHEGAVVGNTPTKVKRPTYEQIYLLRLEGYESQLLRISPTSNETVHVTLRPSDNPTNQRP